MTNIFINHDTLEFYSSMEELLVSIDRTKAYFKKIDSTHGYNITCMGNIQADNQTVFLIFKSTLDKYFNLRLEVPNAPDIFGPKVIEPPEII